MSSHSAPGEDFHLKPPGWQSGGDIPVEEQTSLNEILRDIDDDEDGDLELDGAGSPFAMGGPGQHHGACVCTHSLCILKVGWWAKMRRAYAFLLEDREGGGRECNFRNT